MDFLQGKDELRLTQTAKVGLTKRQKEKAAERDNKEKNDNIV